MLYPTVDGRSPAPPGDGRKPINHGMFTTYLPGFRWPIHRISRNCMDFLCAKNVASPGIFKMWYLVLPGRWSARCGCHSIGPLICKFFVASKMIYLLKMVFCATSQRLLFLIWLVVSNMVFICPFHTWNNPSHWLIFFRGVGQPPTSNTWGYMGGLIHPYFRILWGWMPQSQSHVFRFFTDPQWPPLDWCYSPMAGRNRKFPMKNAEIFRVVKSWNYYCWGIFQQTMELITGGYLI